MRALGFTFLLLFSVTGFAREILLEDSESVAVGGGLISNIPEPWMSLYQSVGLYNNAGAEPITPLLQSARTSIDLEIYEMEDPEVLSALISALSTGVHVRIIKDPKPIGQRCDPFNNDDLKKSSCTSLELWLSAFLAAGGEIRPFKRDTLCGVPGKSCFEHGKMIVVDDGVAAVSSGNFNATNLCDLAEHPKICNRDYTYITRDPQVVGALAKIFAADWIGDPAPVRALVESGEISNKLTVSPFSRAPLTEFLESARSSITLQNQYLTDEDVAAKLLELKAKNPALVIRLNLSDLCEYGKITETKRYKARLMFQAFEDAGIQVRMFPKSEKIEGKRGYLHAKAIVLDNEIEDRRAWVGSVNGSAESLDRNREFGIFFSQPIRVKELAAQLDTDFNDPQSITWQKSVLECPAP